MTAAVAMETSSLAEERQDSSICLWDPGTKLYQSSFKSHLKTGELWFEELVLHHKNQLLLLLQSQQSGMETHPLCSHL